LSGTWKLILAGETMPFGQIKIVVASRFVARPVFVVDGICITVLFTFIFGPDLCALENKVAHFLPNVYRSEFFVWDSCRLKILRSSYDNSGCRLLFGGVFTAIIIRESYV